MATSFRVQLATGRPLQADDIHSIFFGRRFADGAYHARRWAFNRHNPYDRAQTDIDTPVCCWLCRL